MQRFSTYENCFYQGKRTPWRQNYDQAEDFVDRQKKTIRTLVYLFVKKKPAMENLNHTYLVAKKITQFDAYFSQKCIVK